MSASKSNCCVIGSGPAGVACAQALLAQGQRVTMLDAGLKLEWDLIQRVQELAAKSPADWSVAERASLQSKMVAGTKGIGQKLQFNSDFPYRETAEQIPWQGSDTGLLPSLAMGGFSNVWGAAMLPYRDEDLGGWPVCSADLAPHYRAVAAFTGLSAHEDDLNDWFPIHQQHPRGLRVSAQAAHLLARLNLHREQLRSRGWRFGRSRLAVRTEDSVLDRGCLYCRECMGGCVYGCIYNSADTVRTLSVNPDFVYQSDIVVTRLVQLDGGITVEGRHRLTGAQLKFGFNRVYLAAGVISSAQILLRSQEAYDRPLMLRDSQYFLVPLLTARQFRGVAKEAFHTLSQLFVEIARPQVSRNTVHLQVYSHSDMIGSALRASLGPLGFLAPLLEGRMLVVQGYLHSNESRSIQLTLKREGKQDRLHLEAQSNPATAPAVRRVVAELLKHSRALGGMVVLPMVKIMEPGRGFHSGGSLPMRAAPGEFESDTLGRPRGWSRLHIVDASVLPSIPATTITFPVMANAHRIGTETARLG